MRDSEKPEPCSIVMSYSPASSNRDPRFNAYGCSGGNVRAGLSLLFAVYEFQKLATIRFILRP